IDGCPAGVPLTREQIQAALDRRRPGQSQLTTSRQEADQVEILSGVYEDKTLGTPLAAIVRNVDQRSKDYDALKNNPRVGHADRVWQERYKHRDHRGGGRSSGRETLSRVIGGAVAEAFLGRELPRVSVVGWVSRVATMEAPTPGEGLTRAQVDAHPTRCPDPETAARMSEAILAAKERGDSLGGCIDVRIDGLPVGLGEPVFDKLKALLAHGFASVGTVSGLMWGPSDLEDALHKPGSDFHRHQESYGGIQGGLSNGEPVMLRAFLKPPSTLGETAKSGRHDPCILPRAVPVLEAMTSLVVADMYLRFIAFPHRA
ncbi:MAG TPA: chorismate synthase, partial [Myxococcaceae bacterium]|nr:chorismate synthase [Myxococcaceae bacterium]